MRFFFPEYIDKFCSSKNAFSRASIGTRASTGTFILIKVPRIGQTSLFGQRFIFFI